MTTLKFGGFWFGTGNISWNLVVRNHYRLTCAKSYPFLWVWQTVSTSIRILPVPPPEEPWDRWSHNLSGWFSIFAPQNSTLQNFPVWGGLLSKNIWEWKDMGKTEDEEEELDRETVGRLVPLNTIIVVVCVIRSTLVNLFFLHGNSV